MVLPRPAAQSKDIEKHRAVRIESGEHDGHGKSSLQSGGRVQGPGSKNGITHHAGLPGCSHPVTSGGLWPGAWRKWPVGWHTIRGSAGPAPG